MPFAHLFSVLAGQIESLVSQGGYLVLFLITILEGIPVLGMAVPGHITIIVAGFFAKVGTLSLPWVLVVASVGAILGDCIGYYIGRKYGMSFIEKLRPYFFITDEHINKARDLLTKHTGKSMILGRFTPATRALMPFLVGTTDTSAGRFWFFNIVGGLSWVIMSVLVGYIFGAGYGLVAHMLGRVLVLTIIFAILAVWGYRFVNAHFHVFRRYELFTLALNLISLAAFAVTIDKLIDGSFRLGFDIWVSDFMCRLVHPLNACLSVAAVHGPLSVGGNVLVGVASFVSLVGGTAVMGILGLALTAHFIYLKKWRSMAIMFLSVSVTAGLVAILKQFFMGIRPSNALVTLLNDPSFPSGHASMSAAFFTALAYLLAPRMKSLVKREVMIVLCVLAVLAIGLSRLILNVHWLSDVVAGWSVGIFIATSSILFVRYVGGLFMRKQ